MLYIFLFTDFCCIIILRVDIEETRGDCDEEKGSKNVIFSVNSDIKYFCYIGLC